MNKEISAFFRGFRYAFHGIIATVQQERNFRFHLCVAVYVYLFSLFYSFDALRYVVLTVLVTGVLALELMNSALERAVQDPEPRRDALAGQAKDMAAAAVLVFCAGALACAVWLFWDVAVFTQITAWFAGHLLALLGLVLSLAASVWFVFVFGNKKEKPFD